MGDLFLEVTQGQKIRKGVSMGAAPDLGSVEVGDKTYFTIGKMTPIANCSPISFVSLFVPGTLVCAFHKKNEK